jgi:hypothetical protein
MTTRPDRSRTDRAGKTGGVDRGPPFGAAEPLVDISVGSRFHAFDLARELNHRGMLRLLHTGYPRYSAGQFGLPVSAVRSVWTHEPLNRLTSRLFRSGVLRCPYDAELAARFDRVVAGRLKGGADLFIGWSNQCLASIGTAAALGMITIVERGSTHIQWQQQVLQEESERTGLPTEVPTAETVGRELAEYAAADYIAVPTRFVADTFVRRGVDPDKLLINPYGVDLSRFDGQRPPDARSHGLRVLHVGQVSVRKGIHYLVRAVERVPGASLSLVGNVDPRLRPLLASSRVRVLGPVPGATLPDRYREADVFCLLSVEDGFGLVVVQAMAMGLPVIVTPNAGAAELIEDGVNGFVVPVRDPDRVAEMLEVLTDDPRLRLEMGRRARETVLRGFSWSDYGQRAARIYRRVTGRRTGP